VAIRLLHERQSDREPKRPDHALSLASLVEGELNDLVTHGAVA